MVLIKKILGRKILNNRCDWTIEVEIGCAKGSSPSGASKGKFEAEVIDVDKALNIVNGKLKNLIEGKDFDQEALDNLLLKFGGKNFSGIGGNLSTAISFAFYNLNFSLMKEKFPYPLGNVLGGGKHHGFTDIQEFLIIPYKAKSVLEAINTNVEFYKEFRKKLGRKAEGVNDEGAIIAKIKDEKALDLLSEMAEEIPVKLGMDFASSSLWNGKKYVYKNAGEKLNGGEQTDFVLSLVKNYGIYYIEDPFHERDFQSFAELKRKIGKKALICGDDLTATNEKRIKEALKKNAINSVIIKPNQIGTVSLAYKAVELAKKNRILPIISHRSGETEDITISRLALNWEIPVIKCGIFGIRTVKLNELLRLWEKAENPEMGELK